MRQHVLLLDMGNTFMFGCDRFADPDDLARTYRSIGGTRLSDTRVCELLRATLDRMGSMYETPSYYDSFPAVRAVLMTCGADTDLGEQDLDHLEEVFARHEVGTIAPQSVRTLQQLAERCRLGVVSNVWAPSRMFREAFAHADVLDLFETVVFSSDHGCIKPSAALFRRALQDMNVPPDRAWYVGDDLRCDIGGAQAAGLQSIWINRTGRRIGENDPMPDRIIAGLGELLAIVNEDALP